MNQLQTDLSEVDKLDLQNIAGILGVETAAGQEYIRYALANARLMDRKQRDYGPRNISECGVFGVIVRMNDKVARLRNLIFNAEKDGRKRRKKVHNESVTDSFRDISNYGVIGQMLEDSKWPTT